MAELENEYWRQFAAGEELEQEREFYCPAPPSSTSQVTAAVLSGGLYVESLTAKPGQNSAAELMDSKARDDLQWMLGTGRYGQ